MKIEWSNTFTKEHSRLSIQIQRRFEEEFHLFIENPAHPSLVVRKMSGTSNIWEARINDNYRWTFEPIKDGIKLRHIGTHNLLKNP